MLVVTITKWRKKLAWFLAVLLVVTVVLFGQISLRPAGREETSPVGSRVERLSTDSKETVSIWQGLVARLRNYYQGKQPFKEH